MFGFPNQHSRRGLSPWNLWNLVGASPLHHRVFNGLRNRTGTEEGRTLLQPLAESRKIGIRPAPIELAEAHTKITQRCRNGYVTQTLCSVRTAREARRIRWPPGARHVVRREAGSLLLQAFFHRLAHGQAERLPRRTRRRIAQSAIKAHCGGGTLKFEKRNTELLGASF